MDADPRPGSNPSQPGYRAARMTRGHRRGLLITAALALAGVSCTPPASAGLAAGVSGEPQSAQTRPERGGERMRMVEQQLLTRGVADPRVIDAMRRVPRERFVPLEQQRSAYDDRPLPIGYRQTISQPYIVAYMTEALQMGPGARVLEVGTGSGYQAAILGEVAARVYTIEIVPELAERARNTLTMLGYTNVDVRLGDGYAGWAEEAPFDAIMVTAAPDHVPEPLIDQLAPGGRMIIPVGQDSQSLILITRTEDGVTRERVLGVRFVPMTGEAERR